MVIINGLVKTTVIDYPGKMAAEVFLGGCNFRCPFCHNMELVKNPDSLERVGEKEVFDLLTKRKKWIDGLVISGGEPTLQKDLPEFIRKVKGLGVLVKLDTNGSNPGMLESLLKDGLLDCVAMDIKAPREKYGKASGADVDMKAIDRSISLIMKSGLDYEFRTTFVPGLHSREDVRLIGEWLKGAKRYCIQNFRSGGTLDPGLDGKPSFTEKELQGMADVAKGYFESVEVRS